jgi:hypothetical protein
MGNVVGYSPRSTVSNSSAGSGSGGGDVEDILKRLGIVETDVSEVRTQVGAILAVIPHLATKAAVAAIPHLATRADVADVRAAIGAVKADVAAVETAIIKWIIATTLASAALAFTIAKFVH